MVDSTFQIRRLERARPDRSLSAARSRARLPRRARRGLRRRVAHQGDVPLPLGVRGRRRQGVARAALRSDASDLPRDELARAAAMFAERQIGRLAVVGSKPATSATDRGELPAPVGHARRATARSAPFVLGHRPGAADFGALRPAVAARPLRPDVGGDRGRGGAARRRMDERRRGPRRLPDPSAADGCRARHRRGELASAAAPRSAASTRRSSSPTPPRSRRRRRGRRARSTAPRTRRRRSRIKRKCLRWLREGYAALAPADRALVDADARRHGLRHALHELRATQPEDRSRARSDDAARARRRTPSPRGRWRRRPARTPGSGSPDGSARRNAGRLEDPARVSEREDRLAMAELILHELEHDARWRAGASTALAPSGSTTASNSTDGSASSVTSTAIDRAVSRLHRPELRRHEPRHRACLGEPRCDLDRAGDAVGHEDRDPPRLNADRRRDAPSATAPATPRPPASRASRARAATARAPACRDRRRPRRERRDPRSPAWRACARGRRCSARASARSGTPSRCALARPASGSARRASPACSDRRTSPAVPRSLSPSTGSGNETNPAVPAWNGQPPPSEFGSYATRPRLMVWRCMPSRWLLWTAATGALIGISWKFGPPSRVSWVSTYEWMRPWSSGSLVKSMPGTTCAVQNATCSVSAKKLSGLRFEHEAADRHHRHELLGHELRRVEHVEAEALGLLLGEDLQPELPLGIRAGFDRLPEVAAVEVRSRRPRS